MDTILLVVTVLSLAAGFVAVMAARKLKRVDQARSEARAITRTARVDHDRLLAEVRRMRSLLHSALALVDEEPAEKGAEAEAA